MLAFFVRASGQNRAPRAPIASLASARATWATNTRSKLCTFVATEPAADCGFAPDAVTPLLLLRSALFPSLLFFRDSASYGHFYQWALYFHCYLQWDPKVRHENKERETIEPSCAQFRQLTGSSSLTAGPRCEHQEYNQHLHHTASMMSQPVPVGTSAGHFHLITEGSPLA